MKALNVLRHRRTIIALAVILACGAGTAWGSELPSPAPAASVEAFLDRYVAAIAQRDTAAMADMYTDPVEWTDPAGTRTYSRTELKALFDGMYSVVTEVYDAYVKDVTITVSGDTAVVHFTGVQDVYNSILGQRIVSEVPTVWTLRQVSERWYIAKSSAGP